RALFVTWLSSRERKAAMSLVHAHDQLDLKIHELEKSHESYSQAQMELAHANRVATMGQLSASIAHEISQPIGAALSYANAARNRKPLIFYPSIPPIFWIPFVTGLYLKFRLYGVGYPATEKRFFVSVWMLGVVTGLHRHHRARSVVCA